MKLIELISGDGLEFHLAECLRHGQMPPNFLRTSDNSTVNTQIHSISDDSIVRTNLSNLLKNNISEIVEYLPDEITIVDLNACGMENGKIIIRALPDAVSPCYLAVDINKGNVDKALKSISDIEMDKAGIVAFIEDLPAIKEHWQPPALICLLGNVFSSYEADFLLNFLHEQMTPDDLLLFDCHLLHKSKPHTKQSKNTSDSRLNMVANIRPLTRRGMSLDAFTFHSETESVDLCIDKVCKTNKWLDITSNTSVFCGSNYVPFDAGSRIELGCTFSYKKPQVMNYLSFYGFQEVDSFLSRDKEYFLMLARMA